ncbi:hypothetical protein [Actinomyces provencensis]|uniref:hypothetical protein n=1 Tax=Actinomyces provencensis TaxID=1720198 RepID=UPI00096A9876|nr:hypothetical protein [Actinomyces provencensis]
MTRDLVERFRDFRVMQDGTVWATDWEGSRRFVGCFEHRGKVWVALAPRGGHVIHEAPTRRAVVAWIKAIPCAVA